MKNILFIIPPYFNIQDYINNDMRSYLPTFAIPYGVLSMDSYIRSHSKYSVNIDILDLNLQAYKIVNSGKASQNINIEIENSLKELIFQKLKKEFDIVGISALFNTCYDYIEIILSTIKGKLNPPLCVIGGGLASNLYENILQDFPLIDGICYAEGEIPMTDLIDSDNYKELMNSHPSWVTVESLKNGRIPVASYVENLDDIPMFSYETIDLNDYKGRAADVYNIKRGVRRELQIHTSRGCPFNCTYCSNSSLHGNKIRYMSVERVIAEVDIMIEKFNMDVLLIEDDHFLGNKKRAASILEKLSYRNIRIEFQNGLAVYAIDDEIGFLLRKSGVTGVSLAVESGSDFVLRKLMNKPLKKYQIKKAVDILRRHGIRINATIVLGMPGEMDEHRSETIEMIKDIGFDWVYFFIAIPVVGSRLYDICIENNYLTDKNFRNHLHSKSIIKAPGVDPKKMQQIQYIFNLDANFVHNYNVRFGNYEVALIYFQKIVQKYPKHAFVYYALSECYKLSGKDINLAKQYASNFQKIINSDPEWRFYAEHFGLLDYE